MRGVLWFYAKLKPQITELRGRRLRAHCSRRGLGARVEEIQTLRIPAWHMNCGPAGKVRPGCSKLGGLPDVTDDFIWPELEGRAYKFMAQINLAELPKHPDRRAAGMLPASKGLMLFFSNFLDKPTVGVPPLVYLLQHTRSAPLRPAVLPAALQSTDANQPALPLIISAGWSLPYNGHSHAPPHWTESERQALDTWMEEIFEREIEEIGGHQFMGCANAIQYEPEQTLDKSYPVPGTNWQQLLQVKSNKTRDWQFGDMGELIWLVPAAATRLGDFRLTTTEVVGG